MEINKLELFFDFDDVVIRTRPRLEQQLLKAYKYASASYWQERKAEIESQYQKKLISLRVKEVKLRKNYENISKLLNRLYEAEMTLYTDYIRRLEELDENVRYIGINIDYVLEVLNNGCNYTEGDNPNSPYYIDYNEILDMKYVIPHSVEFIKEMMNLPNVHSSILSHKNCGRESIRKKAIISENIGNIDIHVLDFHSDAFSTGKRQINSKAEYVMNLYGIDCLDESFILIDDSKTNICDWISYGGKGILYSPIKCDGIKWQMQEMTYEAFTNCIDDEQKKLIKR